MMKKYLLLRAGPESVIERLSQLCDKLWFVRLFVDE